MNKEYTLKELSAISGVSMSSISRYMADPGSVKPSTSKKIEYAVNKVLRHGNAHRSNLISIVVPDLSNEFFPLLLKGVESVAASHGFTLIVCSSHGDTLEEDRILNNLMGMGVAGIICVCANTHGETMERISRERQVPIIFLDRQPGFSGCFTITSDNDGGMYQGVKYLLSLGHRRILYLSGPQDVSTERERYSGFLSAFEDEGLEFDDSDRIAANFDNLEAYSVVKDLIEKGEFDYTAICASNDLMAIGAYIALQEHRIPVPDQVSIIGFDDIPSSRLIHLTTIRQPFEEMGRLALLEFVNLRAYPLTPVKNIVLPTSIVIRDSCKAARIGNV